MDLEEAKRLKKKRRKLSRKKCTRFPTGVHVEDLTIPDGSVFWEMKSWALG